MLTALYRHGSLNSLWGLADWSYTSKTPLWLRGEGGFISSFLVSANGVRQGCGLGSVLFAISMKEVFAKVQRLVPEVRVIAIMDDVYMVGELKDAVRAYEELAKLCEGDPSLRLNHEKGKFIYFGKTRLSDELTGKVANLKLKVHRKVVKVLGAPIGIYDKEVKRMLKEIVEKYQTLFIRLRHKKMLEVTAD